MASVDQPVYIQVNPQKFTHESVDLPVLVSFVSTVDNRTRTEALTPLNSRHLLIRDKSNS